VDEAKLKMYARYAGLGALGGVYFFIMDTTIDIFDKGWEEHLFLNYYSLPLAMMIVLAMFDAIMGTLGGIIFGIIRKKWWWSFLGGLLSSGLFTLFARQY
jgi:hypothetical protein